MSPRQNTPIFDVFGHEKCWNFLGMSPHTCYRPKIPCSWTEASSSSNDKHVHAATTAASVTGGQSVLILLPSVFCSSFDHDHALVHERDVFVLQNGWGWSARCHLWHMALEEVWRHPQKVSATFIVEKQLKQGENWAFWPHHLDHPQFSASSSRVQSGLPSLTIAEDDLDCRDLDYLLSLLPRTIQTVFSHYCWGWSGLPSLATGGLPRTIWTVFTQHTVGILAVPIVPRSSARRPSRSSLAVVREGSSELCRPDGCQKYRDDEAENCRLSVMRFVYLSNSHPLTPCRPFLTPSHNLATFGLDDRVLHGST